MPEASLVESKLNDVKKVMQAGNFAEAENYLLAMISEVPKNGDILYLLAVCQRYQKNHFQALDTLKRLRLLVPDHSRAYQEIGHVYRAMNQVDAALNSYSQATLINPALEASLRCQIEILRVVKRPDLAVRLADLEQELKELKAIPPPLLAVTDLISQGKLVKAEQLCKAFMQKNPKHIEGMRLLADIGVRLGVLEDAEFLLETALEFSPQSTKVRVDYIQVLRKQQKYQEALANAKILIQQEPNNPQFQSVFAVESMQSGDYDTALTTFDSILKILPEEPVTLTSRGNALKTQGRKEEAIDSYRRAIKKYPAHGEAYYSLANLKLFSFTDKEIEAMESQEANPGISYMARIYLDFALGKAYEDMGDFDKAFSYYERGNSFKRSQSRYKAEDITTEFHAQADVFDDSFVQAIASSGAKAADPIFIVGLPRSGSTLLEQILASHSQVDGTMELPNILSLAQKLRRGDKLSGTSHYPSVLKTLDAEALSKFGEAYIKDTRVHRGSAPFFIDKMPNNFRHIGLINLILPNAKIIDARRHPMGCCFSAFKQLFHEGQEFTYGLEQVGTYYKDYVELMDHWDKVLPGKVLRVQYEEVVSDLDTQVRRILDYCGLDFEENCISFYETDRSVRTPSSEQVRQPIYQSGVDQWKNFEANLEPLKKALGPVLKRYPIQ
ncbi:MAG: tetratricopeptide repeat protein [Porticoccaceae bacterium]|jgi:tetratricopeptide (TPR) repeat protein|nr:tetratricopeptide repeat protein [Porticoccaceae bacterium]